MRKKIGADTLRFPPANKRDQVFSQKLSEATIQLPVIILPALPARLAAFARET
jgi:hypothetical protein